jgi:hypothetical protein
MNASMDGKRLLTKKQIMAELGVGKRLVNEMFADPGFPVRYEKNKTAYVWEPEFWAWFKKEWRRR